MRCEKFDRGSQSLNIDINIDMQLFPKLNDKWKSPFRVALQSGAVDRFREVVVVSQSPFKWKCKPWNLGIESIDNDGMRTKGWVRMAVWQRGT